MSSQASTLFTFTVMRACLAQMGLHHPLDPPRPVLTSPLLNAYNLLPQQAAGAKTTSHGVCRGDVC
jgi:hypothetical protein